MNLQIIIKEYQAGQIMFSLPIKYSGFFILVIGEEEIQENENADTVHLKVQIVSKALFIVQDNSFGFKHFETEIPKSMCASERANCSNSE